MTLKSSNKNIYLQEAQLPQRDHTMCYVSKYVLCFMRYQIRSVVSCQLPLLLCRPTDSSTVLLKPPHNGTFKMCLWLWLWLWQMAEEIAF